MDFTIPGPIRNEEKRFQEFLDQELSPNLAAWYREGIVPRTFYEAMGRGGWFGFEWTEGRLRRRSVLREAVIGGRLARMSPGTAVAALAHADLGMMGLSLFGAGELHERYGSAASAGRTLLCLGNTEAGAGSDAAGISMRAAKADRGWILDGTKAFVTNGLAGDLAVVTAVSDPEATRNRRISMFLVDLHAEGVSRKKLDKQVWIPSDLTRIRLQDVFVPEDHLLGERGRGLRQVLAIFTNSRVPISALTLGTAEGAFDLALHHMSRREIFGRKLIDFQAKAFECADLYARMEAARLMLCKACDKADRGEDFVLESSLAKYLSVSVARELTAWAADLFGAASVMLDHPIHKFPMDAWASSLGEGTQDVQKLIIFREILKMKNLGL